MTEIQAIQAQLDAAQASLDQAVLLMWRLGVFALAGPIGVAVHELGHVVMARRGGLPVRMIRLGTGPAWLRWRFGRAWLVVRAVPLSGGVIALAPDPGIGRAAGYLLGGIAGNAALIVLAGLAWLPFPSARWWLEPAAAAQLVLIAGSAAPFAWRDRHGRQHRTDGERLRRLRWEGGLWSATAARDRLAQRLGLAGPLPIPSAAWPEIAYQVTRPERVGEAWARLDTCAVLRALVDDPALTWFERLLARDELILQEAVDGEGVLTPAALDAWSASAFEAMPTGPIRIARAGALCRLGRWDEAEPLLDAEGQAEAGARTVYAALFAARLRLARARANRQAAPAAPAR